MDNPQLKIFWINVDVVFSKPVQRNYIEQYLNESINEIEDESSVDCFGGFIKEFGITANSEEQALKEIRDIISSYPFLFDVPYTIKFEHIGTIAEHEIDKEIFSDDEIDEAVIQDPRIKGIYYESGRAFYAPEL